MNKNSIAIAAAIAISITANSVIAAPINIVDHSSYFSDTNSGLDWLKLTETRGLSYNKVQNQTVVGSAFYGWRYATGSDFEALMQNFGILPQGNTCAASSALYCDTYGAGNALGIETAINLLGDTKKAYLDDINAYGEIEISGKGGVSGILHGAWDYIGGTTIANIRDGESVVRATGNFLADYNDEVFSAKRDWDFTSSGDSLGSFLIRNSTVVANVPEPSALWLMAIGMIGFIGRAKKSIKAHQLSA
ncbi:MAG: PEP-CTERM sorting domain-containing protein [Candidatus Polarisedimenticolaceae bacterium]|nr:PEP-CTERM sorting domain-containing protein [Candidatus Polarisedimenticolaceae bacterium]